LLFKGSGFYITDYRSDKYREAAKKESGSKDAGAGSNGSGAAGSEAKPAKTAGPATSKSEGKAGLAEKKI
jgi:predicted nucleic acid-binding Zn ribbon protein